MPDLHEVIGVVIGKYDDIYSIELPNNRIVVAHRSGRLKRAKIKVSEGDRVALEIQPEALKGYISKKMG